MLEMGKKKFHYEKSVVTNVCCDVCNKDLSQENTEIVKVRMLNKRFKEGKEDLEDYWAEGTDARQSRLKNGTSAYLCKECAKKVSDYLGGKSYLFF